jgi:pimeloyl-ACP methyl ester carboxylesterase
MRHSVRKYVKHINAKSSRRGAAVLAVGIAMAAAAIFVRQRTRATERANPPMGRFIEVDGVRLHYVESGEGQPLVLLHGNGTMAQDFDISGLTELASQQYRVIAFDRPGFGYSERPRRRIWSPQAQADLLHKALQRLGVSNAIVLGHSWGTLVAVALALKYSSDVQRLILLSGYYFPTLRLDALLASQPAIPILGDIMRFTVSPLIGRMMWPGLLRKLFGPARVPSRFDRFPVWMALRPSQLRASAAESALMVPAAIALRGRYQELTMPVVIMAGAGDRIANAKRQSFRLSQQIAQSELHVLPRAGHMIHHLSPREVMAAIGAPTTSMSAPNPRAIVSELPSAALISAPSPPAASPLTSEPRHGTRG